MKAVVLDTDDQFRLAEVEEPAPGPGEVAIRVAYAGIQWGDVLVREGHFPVPRPFVPGFEAAGEIVAVGEGVDPARVGQRVTALTSAGAYAEVAVAPAVLAFPTGELEARTAAGFGWVTPTAYDLINTVARVRAGESVLVQAAAGGVGTRAVQFARAAGAGRVVGVLGHAAQAAYAEGFGYDRLLPAEEFADDEETFDVILDPIGGTAREAALQRLNPHGRLVVYGNIATFAPVAADVNDLLMAGTSLLTYNSNLLSQTHPERLATSAHAALALVEAGAVRLDVTAEYDLAELPTAIDRLAAGTTYGKSVLRVG
jgi:NADPH2:quinone reductase